MSYVHINRTGGGNLLPINGPQVINAVVSADATPLLRRSGPTQQGYPAGLDRSVAVQPAARRTSATCPRDYHSSRGAELVSSRCSASSGANMLARRRLRRQPGRRPAAARQLQPGGAEQRRRHDPAAAAPADSGLRRHHLRVQRRQVALQRVPGEVRVAAARRRHAAQLADAVEGQGQRRGLAREPERQLPGAAGLPQPRRRLRRSRRTTSPTTARRASSGRCRSAAASAGAQRLARLDALVGGWQLAGINTVDAGRAGHVHLHAAAPALVSGITQDFRGANNYRPNVTCDPYAAKREQTITNWFNRDSWWCRPIPASRSATRRATACAARSSGSSTSRASKHFALGPASAGSSSASRRSTCSTGRTSGRRTAIAASAGSGRSRRPTMRGSCSWGSS